MLLADVVAASAAVAATRSRKLKVAAIADVLRAATPEELPIVASWIGGSLRQRRTGLGWRSVSSLPPPAASPSLEVLSVDAAFAALGELAGSGSQLARSAATATLFGQATTDEQAWLRGVVTGAVRQGALDALVQEGIALAADVPLAAVRRAAMLAGSTTAIAPVAFASGAPGLAAIGLEVGRPVLPMLASSEPDVAAAFARAGGSSVVVDHKLDGIRIQAHKSGSSVVLATRTLEDITARLPEVVAVVQALPADRVVLDGEALALGPDGRPRPFQETASRTASAAGSVITPYFFDLLHLDGNDLLDAPLSSRMSALAELVPAEHVVPRVLADSPDAAAAASRAALAAGHEGVVVKALDSAYAAGRRGAAWVKVKPVHTLDLVVLAVEEGSGRRRGWLSNIHLGARSPDGGFVMLGKTFKGMTDEVLAWQTERLQELETRREGIAVFVRPELVVEIALDGVQTSRRYPGGVALRFARVRGYRPDKDPEDADLITTVQAMRAGSS